MIWDAVTGLVGQVVGGFKDHFEHKRELEKAKTNAKIQRLNSKQDHKQKWEIKQLENTGWKDDILFYFFIGLFIYAGFYPEMANEFFQNLSVLPDWFIKTWMWLVASVLGVKKIGDYGPQAIKGIKEATEKVVSHSESVHGRTDDGIESSQTDDDDKDSKAD